MRRVLFVDDEPNILESLRDALRPRRHEWHMAFADSGDAALEVLRREPFDVVVSDMRMPVMDGAALLARVRELQPDTVRIILSGHANADRVVKAAPAAHRFLGKPCDVQELAAVIHRSCSLLDLTRDQELRRSAVQASALPSQPRIHGELAKLLADPDAGLREAAAVVARDTALTGRVLQLANSGFFGLSRQVTQLEEAVNFLGLRALEALVLATEAAEAFPDLPPIAGFSVEQIQQRASLRARLVRELLPHGSADDAVAAALLHDIGLLVLASQEPDYLADVLTAAEREGRRAVEIEYERRGVSHAEVGAHLLALWNLPHAVIEAVAFHHRPLAVAHSVPRTVAALHIADAVADDPGIAAPWPQLGGDGPWPTAEALETLGFADRLESARSLVAQPSGLGS